jgi:hypothetical protein
MDEQLYGMQQRLEIIDRSGREGAEHHVKKFMIRHHRLLGLTDDVIYILRRLMELGI